MSNNLYDAFNQWATRPPDERFASMEEMLRKCKGYYENSCESTLHLKNLNAVATNKEVNIAGESGRVSKLTHWTFGQLSSKANAPANYLRTLPAQVAADCLNFGFERFKQSDATMELMFQQIPDENGQMPLPQTPGPNPLLLRAITSEKYKRIWNWEVVEKLQDLLEKGWRVPPARPATKDQPGTRRATEDDVLADRAWNLSVKVGDPIAPAGLYASDHDMFAFLIFENTRIYDGTDEGLSRGVFFENSEVGDKALRCTTFLYRHVCGNHIVWDVSKVNKRRIIHTGKARFKFEKVFKNLTGYQTASAKHDELKIRNAQEKRISQNRDDLIDKLFTKLHYYITREQLEVAFDYAELNSATDGDPHSVWGMVQGITRLSQETPFADVRTKLDRAAGKVMRIRF